MSRRYVFGRSSWGCLFGVFAALAIASPTQAADGDVAGAGSATPSAVAETVKGHKQLSDRDKLISEAERKLSTQDFDRFMNNVGALEAKVKQGKPRPVSQAPDSREPAAESLSGDGIPDEVDFGDDPNPIQKPAEFFKRPVSD